MRVPPIASSEGQSVIRPGIIHQEQLDLHTGTSAVNVFAARLNDDCLRLKKNRRPLTAAEPRLSHLHASLGDLP